MEKFWKFWKAESNGWYKININNLEGYVSAEYVESMTTLPVAESIATLVVADGTSTTYSSANASQKAIDIINYAYQFLGNPYVYGGNSLTNGIDCSGFCQQIFGHFRLFPAKNIFRISGCQGTRISYTEAQPGDILVYRYSDGSGHVAIYIGNGKIVHASTPATGICIGNAYFTTPYCAVRVIS